MGSEAIDVISVKTDELEAIVEEGCSLFLLATTAALAAACPPVEPLLPLLLPILLYAYVLPLVLTLQESRWVQIVSTTGGFVGEHSNFNHTNKYKISCDGSKITSSLVLFVGCASFCCTKRDAILV